MSLLSYLFLASVFTWGLSALGAASIFLFNELTRKASDIIFCIASGVMISVSFFSLLLPALEHKEVLDTLLPDFVTLPLGMALGAMFILVLDMLLYGKHEGSNFEQSEKGRSKLLVIAIAAHNIPEALAVGVAFGAYATTKDPALLSAAITLTIGIGIHNLAEGAAATFPLFSDGYSRMKSFHLGHLSAAVYPLGIFVGAWLMQRVQPILPFVLSFAAGTMLYVVFEELLPPVFRNQQTQIKASVYVLASFLVMMTIELLLG